MRIRASVAMTADEIGECGAEPETAAARVPRRSNWGRSSVSSEKFKTFLSWPACVFGPRRVDLLGGWGRRASTWPVLRRRGRTLRFAGLERGRSSFLVPEDEARRALLGEATRPRRRGGARPRRGGGAAIFVLP